ncbi:hypothetical protein QEH59_18175 [Coraliomargarita sp. SDUM461004]|uniref:Uncharacterized protein n=1 Tax=Thalassobacterium sedimentorum TaxID=3041258 RepID=A0ABU1ANJ0_9BACT|nr:hypothetical protein [Coraliomargarita sp. SDUM461004]MDQ8196363.1 hypothetical protein [Coraliomargarita sp. SDUM461004]
MNTPEKEKLESCTETLLGLNPSLLIRSTELENLSIFGFTNESFIHAIGDYNFLPLEERRYTFTKDHQSGEFDFHMKIVRNG